MIVALQESPSQGPPFRSPRSRGHGTNCLFLLCFLRRFGFLPPPPPPLTRQRVRPAGRPKTISWCQTTGLHMRDQAWALSDEPLPCRRRAGLGWTGLTRPPAVDHSAAPPSTDSRISSSKPSGKYTPIGQARSNGPPADGAEEFCLGAQGTAGKRAPCRGADAVLWESWTKQASAAA